MINDLKRQHRHLSAAVQDILNQEQRPLFSRVVDKFHARLTGLARLWQLLAPVDHQSNAVTYNPEDHDNGLRGVMASVIATFPRSFTASEDAANAHLDQLEDSTLRDEGLNKLRKQWMKTMGSFEDWVIEHPHDEHAVCTGCVHT